MTFSLRNTHSYLDFFGWRWDVVGSGGSILGGVGFLWVVVGSGGSILGGGWWWRILCMVVGLVGGDG